MNIFYLDDDIDKCAKAHMDKHVVKMVLECAQILCSAAHLVGTKQEIPYRLTHKGHPCVVWATKSQANWNYVKDLCAALNEEYKYRYDKADDHKAYSKIKSLKCPETILNKDLTERPQCMPKEYHKENPVDAYRLYYNCDKRGLASWKSRNEPAWWLGGENTQKLLEEISNV